MIAGADMGETQPELETWGESLHWIRLGEFGKLIKIFQKEGVSQVILAGEIDKKKMFSRVRPDLKGLLLMAKKGQRKDDLILRTVARELAKEGLEVLPSTTLLPSSLAPPGVLTACGLRQRSKGISISAGPWPRNWENWISGSAWRCGMERWGR